MKGYSSRAFLSNYTAIADSKWWRKLTDTNDYLLILLSLIFIRFGDLAPFRSPVFWGWFITAKICRVG